MVNRPILEIELDDSAFTRFLDKFKEYEDELKKLPSFWQASGKEIAGQKTQFEKITAEVAKASNASTGIATAQAGSNKLLDASAISLGLLSTHGKHFAANIHRSTQSLMKWTKLTGVFSGLLAGGGLFGISRMAASAAGQRTSATGLGVSYTEQASFLTNFGPLGNPDAILQGFSQGLSTPIGKAQIAHLLGHRPTGDAAETASEAILKFKTFVDQTPNEQLGKRLEALGYSNLGLGVEQAKVIRGIPREELEGRARDYREGKTSALALDPAMAKKWTEFSTQVERAGRELETTFARGLKPLIPGIEHLSDSFVHLVDNLLKDGSPIKGWVDSLGSGIGKFADAIGDKSFQRSVSQFVRDSGDAVRLIENAVAAAPGGASALVGIWLAARYGGGAAVAIGEGLAGIGALETGGVLAGAAFLKYGNPRQRQSMWDSQTWAGRRGTSKSYQPGEGEPTLHQSGADGSPAQEGTPWNHQLPSSGEPLGDATHHPRRYQGSLSVDGQTFDYASGSPRDMPSFAGHGASSPFGDHPITGFSTKALRGRGGGAFTTKDTYDPELRITRTAVEIHMSNSSDISRVETAGCYGIPSNEWPAAKAAIQRFMANHPEGATLRVHPDGRAEIVSRTSRVSPEAITGKPSAVPVSGGIQSKDPADIAEKMIGLHDRNPRERALLKQYLATGGHGMDPADVNWCASFVSATLHHAGLSDIPAAQGGDVALSYMNWGTKVSPDQVRRGDIMIGGTQGHKPGQTGGHVAIVTGPAKDGKIPIIEGDQRDDVTSYMRNPGSVYSKVKLGPEYHGGHNVNRNTVGAGDEGLMFRRPPAVGRHPADLERGKPTGVDITNEHSGANVDVSN